MFHAQHDGFCSGGAEFNGHSWKAGDCQSRNAQGQRSRSFCKDLKSMPSFSLPCFSECLGANRQPSKSIYYSAKPRDSLASVREPAVLVCASFI